MLETDFIEPKQAVETINYLIRESVLTGGRKVILLGEEVVGFFRNEDRFFGRENIEWPPTIKSTPAPIAGLSAVSFEAIATYHPSVIGFPLRDGKGSPKSKLMRATISRVLETSPAIQGLTETIIRPKLIDSEAYTQGERMLLQNEFDNEPVDWSGLREITEDALDVEYDFLDDVDESNNVEPNEEIEGLEEVSGIQEDNERDREEGWPYSDDNDFPDNFR